MARIDLVGVNKAFGAGARPDAFALRDVTLRVPEGKTLVVLGPSGCGKTTLLKIIAGLIAPDAGVVRYDDVDVRDMSPGERRIGMVFQNYALYPHVTSKANVLSYFMFRRKTPALDALAEAKFRRTSELMGVELAHLLDRKPPTLSGGEKQRVALGRCITRDATVFLVDEPFANLDQALREKYRVNLKALLRQFGITTVYVTHDHHEALVLADLLAVMGRGTIEQVGTPEEIYDRPRTAFVAGFLNPHGSCPAISLLDAGAVPSAREHGDAWVGVRPEDVTVSRAEAPEALPGVVAAVLTLPTTRVTVLTIRVGGHEVHVEGTLADRLAVGERVWLTFRRYHVFDRGSGERTGTVDV